MFNKNTSSTKCLPSVRSFIPSFFFYKEYIQEV
uniref:Uncharacterized protein n=1 Tax=Lepeophtheirus salmonis TaxID=72036 RepID=A0A0K2TZ55_LEPSM